MKTVRIGLVGCGKRGAYVASLFQGHPDCAVTAVMDRHEPIARGVAAKLNLADAWVGSDFDRLLRDAPVDALLISTDPMEQVDLACRAMEHGRHACTEVPAAFTMDDVWRLIRTVEKTGAKYQLMEQTRYWGFVEAWAAMRQRGELGHVCLAQGEYVHYEPHWNFWVDPKTGEVFNDVTPPAGRATEPTWRLKCFSNPIFYLPHTLSPLLKVLDDRVVRVSCMGTKPISHTYPGAELPVRDIEYALMHTAKDTVLLVGAGFTLPNVPRGPLAAHWYELRGTTGSVESPRAKGNSFHQWSPGKPTYEGVELSTIPPDADAAQADSGHGGADFKPVESFIRAILKDTTPAMDVYLTAEVTAPAILAAESSRRGGVLLEVPDFRAGTAKGSAAR